MFDRITLKRCHKGFTLIEILMTIVVVGIIGGFSMGYINNIVQTNQLAAGQKDLVDEGKLAMEYLIRELRFSSENDQDYACDGGLSCPDGTYTTSIQFKKLFGYDEDPAEVITYTFTGNSMTRFNGTTTVTIAEKMTGFTITRSGSFFTITMTFAGPNGENFSLEGGVYPRGLVTL